MEQYKIEKEKIENSILQTIRDNDELDIYGLLGDMLSWLYGNENIEDLRAYEIDNYNLATTLNGCFVELGNARVRIGSRYNPDKDLFTIYDNEIVSINQDDYNNMLLSARDRVIVEYIKDIGCDKTLDLIEHYTH